MLKWNHLSFLIYPRWLKKWYLLYNFLYWSFFFISEGQISDIYLSNINYLFKWMMMLKSSLLLPHVTFSVIKKNNFGIGYKNVNFRIFIRKYFLFCMECEEDMHLKLLIINISGKNIVVYLREEIYQNEGRHCRGCCKVKYLPTRCRKKKKFLLSERCWKNELLYGKKIWKKNPRNVLKPMPQLSLRSFIWPISLLILK